MSLFCIYTICFLFFKVTKWLTKDGNETLQRFINLQFNYPMPMKEIEQEFEKYYFISMVCVLFLGFYFSLFI